MNKKHFKYLVLTMLGGTIGFGYYYFIGCNGGSCIIKSSPFNIILFGFIFGFLISNIIW